MGTSANDRGMAGPRAPACRQRSGHEVRPHPRALCGSDCGLAIDAPRNGQRYQCISLRVWRTPPPPLALISTRSPWRNGRRSSSIRGRRSIVSADLCRATLGGGRRVRWRATPGQQAAVCPPPILEIESGGYRKILRRAHVWVIAYHKEKGPDCPLAPGARHASCSKASTRCRAHFGGRLSSPQTACGAARQLSLAGSAGQLHVARRGVSGGSCGGGAGHAPCATWRLLQVLAASAAPLPYLCCPDAPVGGS